MSQDEVKYFRILSIDGGGYKGLFPAKVIENINNRLRAENGENVHISDYFDMICGTSIGGIIALALSVSKEPSEICKLFEEHGEKLFPFNSTLLNRIHSIKQLFITSKYKSANLAKILDTFFVNSENKKLVFSDCTKYVLIPTFNYTLGQPTIFKRSVEDLNFMFAKSSLSDIALATSAAPSYFPIHYFNNSHYIDGGLFANNPAMVGYIEANDYFVNKKDNDYKYNKIKLLSIGNVVQKSVINDNGLFIKRKSLLGFSSHLINIPMEAQSFQTNYFFNKMSENGLLDYDRIEVKSLNADQEKKVSIDKSSKQAKDLLISSAFIESNIFWNSETRKNKFF